MTLRFGVKLIFVTGEFVRIGMFPIYVHNVACYNGSQYKPVCLWTQRGVVYKSNCLSQLARPAVRVGSIIGSGRTCLVDRTVTLLVM